MRPFILLAATLILLGSPAASLASDFDRAAKETKADLVQAGQEQAQTKQELGRRMAELEQEAAAIQKELDQERKLLAAGQDQLARLSQEEVELSRQLEGRQAEMAEMAGLVRGGARDMLALAERSPITAADPSRLEMLRSYMDKSRFPGIEDIKTLLKQYFIEINSSGRIELRQGEFIDKAGKQVKGDLVRLGAFNTIYRLGDQVGYAQMGPGTGRLLAVGGDLPWQVRAGLEGYLAGDSPSVYMDISGGGALSRLSRSKSWWEQILAGGPLVWPILAVGLAALLLVIERLFYLGRVHANTDNLMETVNRQVAEGDFEAAWAATESQKGRPTSNVLKAGLNLKGCRPEAIQSGLAEAILKEMPRLERFLSTLKVFAAVAPLLGLLGTVSGMINTFHVITAHGTGDPRLMAGGISEALITTQLGLSVAIPILMLSSLLNRQAQHVLSDMEEKAVALTAALIKGGK